MALKPCRECGREISDQAEICPNCGIRNPVATSQTTFPSQVQSDEPILSMSGVTVTRTLAKFARQTFPINGIGSVTLASPRRAGNILLGGLLIVFGIGALIGNNSGLGFVLTLVGLLVMLFALLKKHGLLIKTASGDIRAMDGDFDSLSKVKEAIERAATMRG